MAKKKASKKYEEEEGQNRKLSINSEEQGMDNELMSINNETETASPQIEEEGDEEMEIPLIEIEGQEEITEEGEIVEEEDDSEEEIIAEAEEGEIEGLEEVLVESEVAEEEEKKITEEDEVVGNEQVAEEEGDDKVKGKSVPPPKEERDPKLDKEPIEEEDLGLQDDDFLMERKVHQEDLEAHMELKEEGFVGSNLRRPRDFASIFDKGVSSKDDPKLDLSYALQYNPKLKKEVVAQQLLRNYHSRDSEEVANTQRLFKEFNLDEETMEAIQENDQAHEDDDLVKELSKILPSNI